MTWMVLVLMYVTGVLVMTASCVLYCDTEDYDWRVALDWVLWPVARLALTAAVVVAILIEAWREL